MGIGRCAVSTSKVGKLLHDNKSATILSPSSMCWQCSPISECQKEKQTPQKVHGSLYFTPPRMDNSDYRCIEIAFGSTDGPTAAPMTIDSSSSLYKLQCCCRQLPTKILLMHSCQPAVQIKRNKSDKKNLILCKKMSDNSSNYGKVGVGNT